MADDDATGRRPTKAATGRVAKKAIVIPPAKKAVTRKAAVARKAAAEAPVAKRAPARKASAGAAPVRKAAVRKVATKAVAAKKAPAARNPGAILAPQKKQPPPLRLAAEQTFDDDWEQPVPEPVRDDPSARMRAVLRAAAQSLEARDAPAPRTPAPAPSPPPATPTPSPPPAAVPDDAVTRVLVAPVPVDDQVEIDEAIEEVWESEEEPDDSDWAPPDVLDDGGALPSPPPPPQPEVTQVITAPAPAAAPAPETKTKKSRRGLRRLMVALVVLVVLAGAALAALSLLGDEGVDYSKLKVGDCFDSSPSNEVRGVKVEPCSKPHNSEVFFLVSHPAGRGEPYPGKDALVQFAADTCLGQPLTDYLGVPLEGSKFKDFEIVPQESAWKDGRRVLVCGIDTGGEGVITGSVKGIRR